MHKKLTIAAAFAAMLCSAQGASIVTGTGFAAGVRLQSLSGSLITTTVQYAVGSVSGQLPSSTATFAEIRSGFKEFARTTANGDAAGAKITNGTAMTATAGAAGTTVDDFNTRQIYVLIGNTPNLDNATEYAFYTGTTASGTNWLFPADVTAASSVNAIAGSPALINTIVGTEIDNATGNDYLKLYGIPEPTSAVLALMGVLGLARRRR